MNFLFNIRPPAGNNKVPVPSMKLIDTIFPFHFIFDTNLNVLQVGSSLVRLCAAFHPGVSLNSLVSIDKPHIAVDFELCRQQQHTLFMIRLSDSDIQLRGQMLPLCDSDAMLFIGSPWFTRMEVLEQYGLSLDDFAVHDATLEHMLMQQAQDTQLADLQRMIKKLEAAAEEKARLQASEEALAHDLNAASDIRLRFTDKGVLLDVRTPDRTHSMGHVSELIGKNIFSAFPCMRHKLTEAIGYTLRHNQAAAFEYEKVDDERIHYYEARLAATLHGDFLLLARDISERRQFEAQLTYQAFHDPLTQLPNRAFIRDRIEHALNLYGDIPGSIVLFFIDMDDFKLVNDAYGHHIGDELLKAMAPRLRKNLRHSDIAARVGGDEFGILMEGIGPHHQIQKIAERLLRNLAMPLQINDITITPKVSIGIAFNQTGDNVNFLFRNADLAMYEAKRLGKNRIVGFKPELHAAFSDRLLLQSELHQAMEQQAFELYYQPVVCLKTGKWLKLEALARWPHPQRGMVPVNTFIELAEETGLIHNIGRFFLNRACQQTQLWNKKLPGHLQVGVNVNLSALQLSTAGIVDDVVQALSLSGLPAQKLTLEITESTLMKNFEEANLILNKIAELGVSIALDDFGTGYSSLAYLARLPVDTLKIDKSFIDSLEHKDSSNQLVKTIIGLGKSMNLRVVAEGIEQPRQVLLLQKLGCEIGQGYYYSRPVTAAHIEELLHESKYFDPACKSWQTCNIASLCSPSPLSFASF